MATIQPSDSYFSSPEYSATKLVVFTTVFIPVQIICVALRYLARFLINGPWGLDDVLVMFSLVCQLCMAGISIESVKHAGVGHHILYLKETAPHKVTLWGKYLVAISILYFASINIPKLAILALYRRLFPQKGIRIVISVLVGILIAQTISILVAAFAACIPFAANWDPTVPGAVCINKEALFIWSSFPNILTDVIMLVLPIRIVWNLHVTTRLKVALTFTFMVGSLGFITAIVRFTTFFQKNSFIDGTWSAVDLIIWTQIEAGIYLISACLPTYRPLLERFKHRNLTAVTTYIKGASGYSSKHTTDSIADVPLKPGPRIRDLKNSSQGFSQIEDKQGTDPHILVTTDIHQHSDSERGI